MSERMRLLGLLALLGAGWGLTQPLSKIAVSEGYQPLGLVFWQAAIAMVLLGAVTFVRGKRLAVDARHWRLYLIITLLGTVVPNGTFYAAAAHLPSGILSIVLSLVPMFAFPVALMLGVDRFNWSRFVGLVLGLTGVVLIAAPEASLPDPGMVAWVPLALVAPLLYAIEGNYVARWGTEGLDPVQVLFGASLLAVLITGPMALMTGAWIDPRGPWGAPDGALVASSLINAVVYSTYVWLVGRAGPVFAAQVSYLVTGFGVLWAMALLGERFSGWVWLAMLVMFAGLFLVQPRPRAPLASDAVTAQDRE